MRSASVTATFLPAVVRKPETASLFATTASVCLSFLDAILSVFPLDYFVDKSVTLMAVEPGDDAKTPIWDEYKAIIAKYDSRGTDTNRICKRLDY